MGSRKKGNGLHGITNLDPHIYTPEQMEERRRKNREYFEEYEKKTMKASTNQHQENSTLKVREKDNTLNEK